MTSRILTRRLAERDPAGDAPQEVREIPIGVRRAAAWSWRILLIVALLALVVWSLSQVMTLVIPVLVAILLASLLSPLVKLLSTHSFLGRGASAGIALIGLILVIAGMLTLAGRQLFSQYQDIADKAVDGFNTVANWVTGTMGIDTPTINSWLDQLLGELQKNSGTIISGAVSGVSTVGNVVTGVVICLFTLFFLLSGGASIWRWTVGLLPPAARVPTHEAFRRGWKALSAYMRTQVLVAAVDATGIGLGMVFLGLGSYAIPVWLIVFVFSFVPLVGAIVSGAIAVLLVLVLKSWVLALVMVGIVVAVQQIEGNVLQPFLMGKAVELHPLAVFLGVATGTIIAGIPGALFSIPLLAFVNATMLYLTGRDPSTELGTDDAATQGFAPVRRTPHRV
ncbi:AI-2E family transporter [Brachybacterium sp. AOP25-B2-12]|uniref:AI-2E family transporter n=1 Tax=Brachybacterium sp. AOP25-B2-12 TaxID=3457710 RepID=UPI004034EA34